MAEANVSTGPQSPADKYFCYKCNQEMSHVLEDFTCPTCHGGFIEVVPAGSRSDASATGGATSGANSSASFDVVGGGGVDFLQNSAGLFSQLLRGLSDPTGSRGGGAHVRFETGEDGPFNRGRSQGSTPATPTQGGGTTGQPGRGQGQNFSFVFDARPGRNAGGQGGGGTGQGQEPPAMEHMLFNFLNDLIHGLGGGAGGGGGPVLSNYGDYAWGRDGLDTIVTQLMNQMEGHGPPPLATDKIDNLPDIVISQEQIDRKLQCSVCWDDFTLGESVKKLECEHVYHPDCIIPWLKLHGTCPICRKDLTGQVKEDSNAPPSSRFEPDTGFADHSSSGNSSESSNNRSGTGSSSGSSDSSGRTNSMPSGRSFNNSNPVGPLLSLLDPILGLSGITGGAASNFSNSNSNQLNSGRQQGSDRDQSRGNQSGQGPERGFDNMDFEFD